MIKQAIFSVAMSLCILKGASLAAANEPVAQLEPGNFFAQEHIGKFRHGLPSQEVVSLIGKPEQLTPDEQTEDWIYFSKGIHLVIGKDAMGAWVKEITITDPCKWESARGAHIGMPWTDVQKLYKEWKQPSEFKSNWFWVGDLKTGLGFEVVHDKIYKMILGEAPGESIEPTLEITAR